MVRLRPTAERRAAAALVRASMDPVEHPPEVLGDLLRRASEPALIALARHHDAAGWMYARLRAVPDVPEELVDRLRRAYMAAVQRHMHGLWQLARLRTVFAAARVPWAVIKGPVLTDTLHGPPGRRDYHDLDVLVAPDAFREAMSAVGAAGGALLDRNWRLIHAEMRGQLHFSLPGGVPLDLHWDLVNYERRRMAIDTRAVLDRRVDLDVGDLVIPTLDPEDSLIHLGVHAALSGGDELIWLKDIERAVALRPPSWPALIERARAWNVGPPVGLILARAERTLGASVPDAVPRALLGRGGLAVAGLVDRLAPPESSLGGPTPARVVARAAGHGVGGGTAVLARRLVRHFDPREPARSSPFTAAGGEREREAYLDAVADTDGGAGPPVGVGRPRDRESRGPAEAPAVPDAGDVSRGERLRQTDRALFRALEAGDGGVLLDLETGTYHRVNEVGMAVWELLAAAPTRQHVLAEMRARAGAPSDVDRQVESFLSDLVDRRLVETFGRPG